MTYLSPYISPSLAPVLGHIWLNGAATLSKTGQSDLELGKSLLMAAAVIVNSGANSPRSGRYSTMGIGDQRPLVPREEEANEQIGDKQSEGENTRHPPSSLRSGYLPTLGSRIYSCILTNNHFFVWPAWIDFCSLQSRVQVNTVEIYFGRQEEKEQT